MKLLIKVNEIVIVKVSIKLMLIFRKGKPVNKRAKIFAGCSENYYFVKKSVLSK